MLLLSGITLWPKIVHAETKILKAPSYIPNMWSSVTIANFVPKITVNLSAMLLKFEKNFPRFWFLQMSRVWNVRLQPNSAFPYLFKAHFHTHIHTSMSIVLPVSIYVHIFVIFYRFNCLTVFIFMPKQHANCPSKVIKIFTLLK